VPAIKLEIPPSWKRPIADEAEVAHSAAQETRNSSVPLAESDLAVEAVKT
jgi:hypothetical protein